MRVLTVVMFSHSHTVGGGMRQPVFKGLRDDKSALDCVEK